MDEARIKEAFDNARLHSAATLRILSMAAVNVTKNISAHILCVVCVSTYAAAKHGVWAILFLKDGIR